jgi:hypothetical protein
LKDLLDSRAQFVNRLWPIALDLRSGRCGRLWSGLLLLLLLRRRRGGNPPFAPLLRIQNGKARKVKQ